MVDLWPRSRIASSFTILKGALIEESYKALALWRPGDSKKENIERLQQRKFMGAKSDAWYRNIGFVLSRRFDPGFTELGPAELAKKNLPMQSWKPILLWHITRGEFLLRDFLVNWLFPAWVSGTREIRTQDLYPHLQTIADRGGILARPWSETTLDRVAVALLKICVDFELLQGRWIKEFRPYTLPQLSLLYLLHAVRDSVVSSEEVIQSADWRMYRMTESELDQRLSDLSRSGLLVYKSGELRLPYGSALEYVHKAAGIRHPAT
jgi:Putative inner membrane protein (DUF1819)